MPRRLLPLLAIALLTLSGCTAVNSPSSESPSVASPAATDAPASETSPVATPTSEETGAPETAEEAFRAWLTASRLPDAETACGYMSDSLVQKMLDELRTQGTPASDCDTMITTTAELYRALGQSAEVDIDVVREDDETAVLFVTYVGGDCGTVDMVRRAGGWVMTEMSEECAA